MSVFEQGANCACNGLRAESNPYSGTTAEAEWDAGFAFGLKILGDDAYESPPRDDDEAPF